LHGDNCSFVLLLKGLRFSPHLAAVLKGFREKEDFSGSSTTKFAIVLIRGIIAQRGGHCELQHELHFVLQLARVFCFTASIKKYALLRYEFIIREWL